MSHGRELISLMGDEEFASVMEDMDTSDTQWSWYYLGECGKWHIYEKDPNIPHSVSSEDIERNFKENSHGLLSFSTAKYNYIIDFREMKQTNTATGKERPVKRADFSVTAFSFICGNAEIPIPLHWENIDRDKPYQLCPLHKSTNEYQEVAELFGQTMDQNRIMQIQRIQNLDLWELYCRKKAHLKKMRNVLEVNERLLFHGTSSEFVQAICLQNFDWRINGMHATVYGKGTYFARDSSYSSRYCHSNDKSVATLQPDQGKPQFKTMFLARVLVGDYVTGNPKYTRPPSKDGSLVNLYDSCVDNQWNPKIFVVFDANHIYPEYLINFC
ncbi:protein mono-ADP-ribosyltransferase PARP11-like isoform X3 [Hemitrygon akajei]|uniref:protein mono-ADP-ribosyltransferase PARP11-like isoform X3 n=1 Tax=Hemitrygon akajei TaxID=2704970 RepID=UPI003BF96ED5